MRLGLIGVSALLLLPQGCATSDAQDIGQILEGLSGLQGETGTPAGLTMLEVEQGLREALIVGTERVALDLGRVDGYFSDPNIRIPLPGTLGDLQQTLKPIGLSGPFDELQLRLNRGAEAAIPQAKALVIDAVRTITLDDALAILNGGDTAATDFLRQRTEPALREALTPHMRSALSASGAFTALEDVAGRNGLGGLTTSLGEDLTTRAVTYGLDGLFLYVAEEETRIRDNPLARTSEILRRVFGSAG